MMNLGNLGVVVRRRRVASRGDSSKPGRLKKNDVAPPPLLDKWDDHAFKVGGEAYLENRTRLLLNAVLEAKNLALIESADINEGTSGLTISRDPTPDRMLAYNTMWEFANEWAKIAWNYRKFASAPQTEAQQTIASISHDIIVGGNGQAIAPNEPDAQGTGLMRGAMYVRNKRLLEALRQAATEKVVQIASPAVTSGIAAAGAGVKTAVEESKKTGIIAWGIKKFGKSEPVGVTGPKGPKKVLPTIFASPPAQPPIQYQSPQPQAPLFQFIDPMASQNQNYLNLVHAGTFGGGLAPQHGGASAVAPGFSTPAESVDIPQDDVNGYPNYNYDSGGREPAPSDRMHGLGDPVSSETWLWIMAGAAGVYLLATHGSGRK